MNTQRVLTLCVLALTAHRDLYGYKIVKLISNHNVTSAGTIYPLLRRLTKEEYLFSYIIESKKGPARKYYQLTDKGRELIKEQIEEWKMFTKGVNQIIEEGLGNDKTGVSNKT